MTDAHFSLGPIIHAGMVRDAIRDTIAYWDRTYLDGLARLDGQDPMFAAGQFPEIRSFPDALDTSKFPEDQLPSCVVVVPGTAERPVKAGSGKMRAKWACALGVVVSGPSLERTIRLAQLYTAAIRTLLLQHPGLNVPGDPTFSSGIVWTEERYTDNLIRSEDLRTMAAGLMRFTVDTDSVVDVSQGPLTAVDDGTAPVGWQTVESPIVSVTPFPITEAVSG
jgi:hypothetical protein